MEVFFTDYRSQYKNGYSCYLELEIRNRGKLQTIVGFQYHRWFMEDQYEPINHARNYDFYLALAKEFQFQKHRFQLLMPLGLSVLVSDNDFEEYRGHAHVPSKFGPFLGLRAKYSYAINQHISSGLYVGAFTTGAITIGISTTYSL
ncbi:hypothetical protein [Croceimicrobium hydrocarbonivorans]|uniref:Uncharacterized protein n=1 Tax=Croceimicrobium hydrocarbonivorans TaxID=2761580 RepID=A0A7H0VJH7_9FLAO|nr:hypothetical protein [Croceimicrobium hydrocarbonivorans]QNR25875.1 hypothetical protein H4K34_08520 [Croceimicrobium hydrocarbonivorans]